MLKYDNTAADNALLGLIFRIESNRDNITPYKQYRIVQVTEDEYQVHQVCYEGYFGLPKWIGGNRVFHWKFFWEHGIDFTRSPEVYSTYKEAKNSVTRVVNYHKNKTDRTNRTRIWKVMEVYDVEV